MTTKQHQSGLFSNNKQGPRCQIFNKFNHTVVYYFRYANSQNDNEPSSAYGLHDAYNGEVYSDEWFPRADPTHNVFQNLNISNNGEVQTKLELVIGMFCL